MKQAIRLATLLGGLAASVTLVGCNPATEPAAPTPASSIPENPTAGNPTTRDVLPNDPDFAKDTTTTPAKDTAPGLPSVIEEPARPSAASEGVVEDASKAGAGEVKKEEPPK